jgi:hypothetical protein
MILINENFNNRVLTTLKHYNLIISVEDERRVPSGVKAKSLYGKL